MPRREKLLAALRMAAERPDAELDIAEAALLLGAIDHPASTDLQPYRDHLDAIAEEVRSRASRLDSVIMQIDALRSVLVQRHGYCGRIDDYDDPLNANLLDVIDRRRGLPVALGILYMHAGRAYGADLVGLSFPSHFLLRRTARGQRAIIDPFNEGSVLTAEDMRRLLKDLLGDNKELGAQHYIAVSPRDALIRLQNNIKLRAVAAGSLQRAIGILETMTAIVPERGEFYWESAILQSKLGNLRIAITLLEEFLARTENVSSRNKIEDLLRRLRTTVR